MFQYGGYFDNLTGGARRRRKPVSKCKGLSNFECQAEFPDCYIASHKVYGDHCKSRPVRKKAPARKKKAPARKKKAPAKKKVACSKFKKAKCPEKSCNWHQGKSPGCKKKSTLKATGKKSTCKGLSTFECQAEFPRCQVQSAYRTKKGMVSTHCKTQRAKKVVSAAKRRAGQRAFKNISSWSAAVSEARRNLGIEGFVPVGGKSRAGRQLYREARKIHAAMIGQGSDANMAGMGWW